MAPEWRPPKWPKLSPAAVPHGRWLWNLALGAAIAAWIVGSLIVTGIMKLVRFTWRRWRTNNKVVEA